MWSGHHYEINNRDTFGTLPGKETILLLAPFNVTIISIVIDITYTTFEHVQIFYKWILWFLCILKFLNLTLKTYLGCNQSYPILIGKSCIQETI